MRLTTSQWEKMILRWAPISATPEVRLLCAVLATAIAEEPADAGRRHRQPYAHGFFSDGGFERYCAVLGLHADFVMDQIKRASCFDDEPEAVKQKQ